MVCTDAVLAAADRHMARAYRRAERSGAPIEALRESDPAAAHEWRLRLRAQMEGLLGSGLRIAGYDTARGYLFTA